MPTEIIESPVKGTALSVPVGTDKRKASSLTAAWQAIANRLNFLEVFYDAFFLALTFLVDTTWSVTDGKTFKIQQASGSANFDLTSIKTVFNRGVRGRLFQGGQLGQSNRKALALDDPASPLAFDPTLYDCLIITNLTHTLNVQLDPSAPVVAGDGDWFTVVNEETGFSVQVKETDGSTDVGYNLRSFATGFRSASYVYAVVPGSFGAAFQWYQEHAVPYTAS